MLAFLMQALLFWINISSLMIYEKIIFIKNARLNLEKECVAIAPKNKRGDIRLNKKFAARLQLYLSVLY
jgi:hypothetical protein